MCESVNEGGNRERKHYQSTTQSARLAPVWQRNALVDEIPLLFHVFQVSLLPLRVINS
jgi:hypothetical protein